MKNGRFHMTGLAGKGYNHAMTRKLETTGERAVTQLNIEREAPAVKRFFESLALQPGGSILAMNGKRVMIRVLPDRDVEWTEAKNERRLALIDRDIADMITADERLELELLQEEMVDHVEKTAPIPLEYARKLYDEVLKKAGLAKNQS
jgi:hypothetical protein